MFSIGAAVVAFFVGFVPALAWLAFWLLEDRKRPEPKRLIIRAFVAGMIAVPVVLPFEAVAASYLSQGFILLLSWAMIEECMKFGAAYIAVLRLSAVDEPIDLPVYLITAALGFAAVENTLFLLHSVPGGLFDELITGNLRFIGATLIHTLSSAVIGGMLATAFYRGRVVKFVYGTLGVILAVFLHALFNFSILNTSANHLLTVFSFVWIGIVFLLLALERVKLLKRPAWWQKLFVKTPLS